MIDSIQVIAWQPVYIGQEPPMTASNAQIPNRSCRLALAGEIDMANAEDYLALARRNDRRGRDRIVLHHRPVRRDIHGSSGLRMLVDIRKAATDAGMELRLAGTPRRVIQVLEITALADHFGVAGGPS